MFIFPIRFTAALLLLLVTSALAQNSMIIPDVTGNSGDTVTVAVHINNSDSFVAFQTDILLPQQTSYLIDSATLSARAQDHVLSADLLLQNTLRIVVFSSSQNAFSGSAGEAMRFRLVLRDDPGTYVLALQNSIISASSTQNILTSTGSGGLTVLGPDIRLSTRDLDFGRTPLTGFQDKSITLDNLGNTTLNITRIYADNPFFEIIGDTTYALPAGNRVSIPVRFNAQDSGGFTATIFIQSDDADEPLAEVEVSAFAFAVNQLRLRNASGRSGYLIDIAVEIDNMDPVTGFQFDLIMDPVLRQIENDVVLSGRRSDHVVSAEMLSENRLRVLGYSPGNQPFGGSAGSIATLKFLLQGLGGNYPLYLENVIISGMAGDNVMSGSIAGSVNIISPDIAGESEVRFNDTSVLETAVMNYMLANQGNDTLTIDAMTTTRTHFWNSTALPQTILPGTNRTFELRFQTARKGAYDDRLAVFSNDPDESPFYVDLSVTAYAPNFISVRDMNVVVNDTATLRIDVDNIEAFVAFQADLQLPASLTFLPGSARLTQRGRDHTLNAARISSRVIRLFAFSMSQSSFAGNSGAVIELDFLVGAETGRADVLVSNAILADSASKNIVYAAKNGVVSIGYPTGISDDYDIARPGYFVLEQNYPNPFNPSTHIRFSLQKPAEVDLAVYDINGKKLAGLIHGFLDSGSFDIIFDGSHLPSGLYYYVMKAGQFSDVKRMVLLK